MESSPQYIVVIGASAGGFSTLIELVSQLEPECNCAFFVVLHLSSQSIGSYLAHRLQEHTRLKCVLAVDGLPIQRGFIYVAMPNHHMLVTDTEVKLTPGPLENRWRPSIDMLFRSAANHHSSRVIGIVLTGLLNDGTTGMSAIKRSGGTTIVQDPNEAEYPDMPLSVLNALEVDFVVSVTEMGRTLKELTENAPATDGEAPQDVRQESEISENVITAISEAEKLGHHTSYTCTECGGVLFEHHDDAITKYKCHVGHSFTARDLLIKQSEEMENSLWYAIRSLEQRRSLLESLAEKYSRSGNQFMARDFTKRSDEIKGHINNLKTIIQSNLDQPEEF